MMMITHKITMNLDRCGTASRIDAVQGDANTRQIQMELYADGLAWEIPAEAQVLVRFKRPDGGSGAYDTLPDGSAACGVSGNVITAALMPQLFSAAGLVLVDVCLIRETAVISTFQIQIDVHPGAGSQLTGAGDYRNVSGFLPMPSPAVEGQFVRVTEVDEYGTVQSTETAAADEAVVCVRVNRSHDLTALGQTAARYSYHLGNQISLGAYTGYRINRLGVLASPGSQIRFALFGARRGDGNSGQLTQLAVIGNAVADSETGFAALEFAEGYDVEQDATVIMALAAEPVIACYELGSGMSTLNNIYFDDADYSGTENGTVIPCSYTSGLDSDPKITSSLFVRDIDFIARQTLGQYIKEIEKRFMEIGEDDCGMPAVDGMDNGKFLRVVDGVWAAAAVDNAEEVRF